MRTPAEPPQTKLTGSWVFTDQETLAQSTPEGEFEEMLLKAHAPIRAIVTAVTGGFDAEVRLSGQPGGTE